MGFNQPLTRALLGSGSAGASAEKERAQHRPAKCCRESSSAGWLCAAPQTGENQKPSAVPSLPQTASFFKYWCHCSVFADHEYLVKVFFLVNAGPPQPKHWIMRRQYKQKGYKKALWCRATQCTQLKDEQPHFKSRAPVKAPHIQASFSSFVQCLPNHFCNRGELWKEHLGPSLCRWASCPHQQHSWAKGCLALLGAGNPTALTQLWEGGKGKPPCKANKWQKQNSE